MFENIRQLHAIELARTLHVYDYTIQILSTAFASTPKTYRMTEWCDSISEQTRITLFIAHCTAHRNSLTNTRAYEISTRPYIRHLIYLLRVCAYVLTYFCANTKIMCYIVLAHIVACGSIVMSCKQSLASSLAMANAY